VVGQLIVREALECAAARIYCGSPVRAALPSLVEAATLLDAQAEDSTERWEAEITFHHGLVQLTRCQPLIKEFERHFRLNVFYRMNRLVGGLQGRVVDRHARLLHTLSTADPDSAERAIRHHIRSGKEELLGEEFPPGSVSW
jgi:DNA-binding GntR family transcriptional regulator